MPKIPVEKLLNPISEDQPCGPPIDEDIELGNLWREIETEAKGKPEQQFGDTIIEAKSGDWKKIHSNCLKMLESCLHFEPAVYLCVAAVELDGMPGLRDGLKLIFGLIDNFWKEVHPLPDPDDPEDFYEREGIFELMSPAFQETPDDLLKFVERTRNAVLAEARQVGMIKYADILAERSNSEGAPPKEMIVATFTQADPDALSMVQTALEEATGLVDSIQNSLNEKVGSNAADLGNLKKELGNIMDAVNSFISGGGNSAASPTDTPVSSGSSAAPVAATAASAVAGPVVPGTLQSRADVIAALNSVISYYRANEPANPVPLLLQRAKALVNNDFLGIIRNFRPDLEKDFLAILGVTDASDGDDSVPAYQPPPHSAPAPQSQPSEPVEKENPWADVKF